MSSKGTIIASMQWIQPSSGVLLLVASAVQLNAVGHSVGRINGTTICVKSMVYEYAAARRLGGIDCF